MKHFLNKLLRNCDGATAVEYGLILALMVVVTIGSFAALGNSSSGLWASKVDKAAIEMKK